MATSGEGGGGAGGKFRKRPQRRPQTTPYVRPPNALRGHNKNWLSKLVDPASKLISASAHSLFSSVFRKRLLPPPSPRPSPGANKESRDTLQVSETVVPNNPPGTQEPTVDGSANPSNSYGYSGVSSIEQMLKQKTFTRSEIDRLTELLRSRTSDLLVGDENKKTQANLPRPVSTSLSGGEFSGSPSKENGRESHELRGVVSAPVFSSRVCEEDVASPAELAKAYMVSKPSKLLPLSAFHKQLPWEDATLPNNAPFTPKSPITPLISKSTAHVEVPENGFITPRSRGRSAIYCMARTPYPRVHSKDQKGAGFTSNGYGGPSSSSYQYAGEKDGGFGSKQVALKRRSSILGDDIGSVGPIRRIRQKPNLLSPEKLGLPVSGSSFSQAPTSSKQKLHLLEDDKYSVSRRLRENDDDGVRGTNFTLVPSKSTEMAEKILRHLDKLTPTEKSSASKLVASRNKSPAILTTSMLSGKALKSLEDVDSSKLLQNFQDSHNLEDACNTSLPDARDSTSQKQEKVEEEVPQALVVPRNSSDPAVICADTTVAVKNPVPNIRNAKVFAQPPEKKQAFRMSAHEDSVELDDDDDADDDAPLVEVKEKSKTSVVESKGVASEAAAIDRNPTLSKCMPAGSKLNNGADCGINEKNLVVAKSTSLAFPTPSPSRAHEPAVPTPQPISAFGKPVPLKEPNVPPPALSFGNENVDKSVVLPSPSSVGESSGLNTVSDPKPESSYSFGNVSSTDAVLESVKSEGDKKDTHHVGKIMEKSVTVFSSDLSASTPTSSIFSFGDPASNSSQNNEPPASSPTTYSSSTSDLTTSNLANQNFTSSSTHVDASFANTAAKPSISTTTPATASSSSLTTAATAPFFPTEPVFRFGPTVAPSASFSAESTSGVQDSNSKVITESKNSSFGNLINSPSGGTSFASTGTGTSIFAASAPATVNSQSQGFLFGRDTANVDGAQASTGFSAAVTQTTPVQFGPTASSPELGSTGTTFPSSKSLFSSSTMTSAVLSSAAPSSESNSMSSSGGASSLFSSSWPSPIFGPSSNASLFSSSSSSTGFSFGPSASASVAATGNAPSMVFGSSAGASSNSTFSFTSAAANHSSLTPFAQTRPIFGYQNPVFTAASSNGNQMNMDSMAEDPVQASTPAVPVFGQTSISPSPGFVFGPPAPSATPPFQFGDQQNQAAQNASPFQASGSLGAGGSFSLGTGGGDKGRRIVRPKSRTRRK